jgi:hypothetical protein
MILRHLRQNTVAYLALVVGLSTGSAYAAERIANGSVTTTGIQDGTLRSAGIKDDTIGRADINDGVVPQDSDILPR